MGGLVKNLMRKKKLRMLLTGKKGFSPERYVSVAHQLTENLMMTTYDE